MCDHQLLDYLIVLHVNRRKQAKREKNLLVLETQPQGVNEKNFLIYKTQAIVKDGEQDVCGLLYTNSRSGSSSLRPQGVPNEKKLLTYKTHAIVIWKNGKHTVRGILYAIDKKGRIVSVKIFRKGE